MERHNLSHLEGVWGINVSQGGEHGPDGCDVDHRLGCLAPIFIILAESTIAPRAKRSSVPRSPGQASDLEGTLRPLDDLQLPALLFCQGARELLALVACLGDHRRRPRCSRPKR